MSEPMNEERLRLIGDLWQSQCGYCDVQAPMMCTCPKEDPRPVIEELLREIERLRGEMAGAAKIVDRLIAKVGGVIEGLEEMKEIEKEIEKFRYPAKTISYQDLSQNIQEFSEYVKKLGYSSSEATLMTIGYEAGFRAGRLSADFVKKETCVGCGHDLALSYADGKGEAPRCHAPEMWKWTRRGSTTCDHRDCTKSLNDLELAGYEVEISAIRKMYIEMFRDMLFKALAAMKSVEGPFPCSSTALTGLGRVRLEILDRLKEIGVEVK